MDLVTINFFFSFYPWDSIRCVSPHRSVRVPVICAQFSVQWQDVDRNGNLTLTATHEADDHHRRLKYVTMPITMS